MKQVELAKVLGVSKAYISMVVKGKKQPSREVIEKLGILGIHLDENPYALRHMILSHARLPVPTLPRGCCAGRLFYQMSILTAIPVCGEKKQAGHLR